MNLEKKVNVKKLEDGSILRLPRTAAEQFVASGLFRFTTKSKLKSYLNDRMKEIRGSMRVDNHFKSGKPNFKKANRKGMMGTQPSVIPIT